MMWWIGYGAFALLVLLSVWYATRPEKIERAVAIGRMLVKWWIVGFAVIALVAVSVGIWLGTQAGPYQSNASIAVVASGIAGIATVMPAWLNLSSNSHLSKKTRIYWTIALYGSFTLSRIISYTHNLPLFDSYTNGSFCNAYSTYGVQCPPLWYSISDLAILFLPPITALTYIFWPHKPKPQPAQPVTEESARS